MSKMKLIVIVIITISMVSSPLFHASAADYSADFLYTLSDFSGTKPFSSARMNLDAANNEIYAMAGEAVYIFNAGGMEVYRVDYDPNMGIISDVAVLSNGQLAVLAAKGAKTSLVRCNFRVEPLGLIEFSGLPPEFSGFTPDRVHAREGLIYLTGFSAMKVVVTDEQGKFVRGVDLAKEMGMSEKERQETGLGGFALDHAGNMLLTVPAQARVNILSADGKIRLFGKRGSAPGRFGVVTGIAADKDGNILVVDKLRSVVMVFEPANFNLVKEFGSRGFKPGNLIGPDDIVVDGQNRAYVSSLRKRGINVYQLSGEK